MKELKFNTLREANERRGKEWGAENNRDPESELLFRSNEMGGECGEAQNAVKKFSRFLQGMKGGVGQGESMQNLREELADVVICADRIAELLDIDLGAAVVEKFNATTAKYGLTETLEPK